MTKCEFINVSNQLCSEISTKNNFCLMHYLHNKKNKSSLNQVIKNYIVLCNYENVNWYILDEESLIFTNYKSLDDIILINKVPKDKYIQNGSGLLLEMEWFLNNFDNIIDGKKLIINIFNRNVKGQKFSLKFNKKSHDGSEGHWLEKLFNIGHNNYNSPDIFGYELKKKSNKITLGDFSANEYLFSKNKPKINQYNNEEYEMDRTLFIRTFGNSNSTRSSRFSWSGKCIPKYGVWNSCGQMLIFDDNDNLCIFYSCDHDQREQKFKGNNILIAIWYKDKLENHINKKFNYKGFFICEKNKDNIYEKISFGKAFNFESFKEYVKNGDIIFDSGMYEGNNRNYSQFRSSYNKFWKKLIMD